MEKNLNELTDEELILEFQQNDTERAFEILVQRYKNPLTNYVFRFIGNYDVCADVVQETMSFIEDLEPTTTSSMQRDVASGRPFELEAFSGTILRRGRKLGIPTPVHSIIYALLRPALDRTTVKS